MLDSHPEVAVPLDVTGLWSRYAERLADYGDLEEDENVRRLIGDLLAEERIRLWEAGFDEGGVLSCLDDRRYPAIIAAFYLAYARSRGKRRWGDKDPGNMTRIDQIDGWFPDARFLHIMRDGRDACLSHLKQTFGFRDVLSCAAAWREEVEWVRRIGHILGPRRYHELRYEDLVERPELELRRICDFLELPWAPEMLAYHRRTHEAIPASKKHLWPLIDRPPQTANVGRWKRDMSHSTRVCFEKRAGRALAEAGYETLPAPSGAYVEELRHLASGAWRAARRRLRGG